MNDGLKQRLIGAVVLAALAVIFMPTLFNRGGQEAVERETQIPPEPEESLSPLEFEAAQPEEELPAAEPLEEAYPHEAPEKRAQDERAQEDTESSSAPAASGGADGEAAADSADAGEAVLTEEGLPQAWSLQVASFQSRESATALRQRLEEAGHSAYSLAAETDEGGVQRVFIGPELERRVVEELKPRIDENFNTDSLVVEVRRRSGRATD